jgi:hypothetical protein
MLKWKPPARRPLVLVDKGHPEKMIEPWNSMADLENMTFNNMTCSKWYNRIIDTTHRLRILQELLNCNMRNISFSVNQHHTFVWLRHEKSEYFYSRMMSFKLHEETFKK